jgi:GTP-binding protein
VPTAFRILDATFRLSAPTLKILPAHDLPEIAFIGRSNVGKSSLLGELLERPKLVRTSRTPGRTRDVNLFDLRVRFVDGDDTHEADFVFADLPGYGYAKMSQGERRRTTTLLSDYLSRREELVAVCHLLDLRHTPTRDDLEVLEGLRDRDYEHYVVATKTDKLKRNKRGKARRELSQAAQVASGDVTLFSIEEHIGREELWRKVWERRGARA